MAAVAQQYYEEAAQNEQMGEDDGVSCCLFFHHAFMAGKNFTFPPTPGRGASTLLSPRIIIGLVILGGGWR